MIRAFRSEVVKLRQRSYAVGAAGMVAFMTVTMVISIGGAEEQPRNLGPAGLVLAAPELAAADGLGRSLGNAVTLLGIVALTLVAINVGTEYSQGTIRNLLVRQPDRARLLLGKTAALLAYLAMAVLVAAVAAVAVAPLLTPAEVDPGQWWTRAGLAATAGGAANLIIAVWGWGALGLLIGVALRSAPATIGVGVAYALPVEVLAGEISPELARWLPGQLLQTLARGGVGGVDDHATALLGTLVWLLLATAAAAVLFRTRDVPD